MERFLLHRFPFGGRYLLGAAATRPACDTCSHEKWKVKCVNGGNEIEKSYKNKFKWKGFFFSFSSAPIRPTHRLLSEARFARKFIVRWSRRRAVSPYSPSLYESSSAFRLLVGTIRCGKRGEPLTRSRSVGCEFWWIIELRLRWGRMKLTLGSEPRSSASSISTSGTFSTWALIVNAIDFRRLRLFINSGSTISMVVELIALPLWANDDFRSDSHRSSGWLVLRTWHDVLVLGSRLVSKFICDLRALAMCDGANEAVDVFRLGARDPKRHLIRLRNPLRSWFCWCVSRRFSKSIAGTRTPFSSTICGCELKQMERRIGMPICSVLGHEARGITGGRTDNNSNGSVPEMLGRLDFVRSPKSPSMIISGCVVKRFLIKLWNFQTKLPWCAVSWRLAMRTSTTNGSRAFSPISQFPHRASPSPCDRLDSAPRRDTATLDGRRLRSASYYTRALIPGCESPDPPGRLFTQ